MKESHGIETYMVGFFHDVWNLKLRLMHLKEAQMTARQVWGSFFHWFARSWRRKNYWNGYLAEWHYRPDGVLIYKTGRGWTRKRALKSLGREIVFANLTPLEAKRMHIR